MTLKMADQNVAHINYINIIKYKWFDLAAVTKQKGQFLSVVFFRFHWFSSMFFLWNLAHML